jgi:hypothetical protein
MTVGVEELQADPPPSDIPPFDGSNEWPNVSLTVYYLPDPNSGGMGFRIAATNISPSQIEALIVHWWVFG